MKETWCLKRKMSAEKFGTIWIFISFGLGFTLWITLQLFTDWRLKILYYVVAIGAAATVHFTACYIGRVEPGYLVDEPDFRTRKQKMEDKARHLAERAIDKKIDWEKYRKKASILTKKFSDDLLKQVINKPKDYLHYWFHYLMEKDQLIKPYKDELKRR